MARGQKVDVGSKRVSANGYEYTKVAENGKEFWKLTHWIIAERTLGRPIREDERVSFINGKKSDLRPENIRVTEKGTGSIRRRKAQIESRIADLQAELDEINAELAAGRKVNHQR